MCYGGSKETGHRTAQRLDPLYPTDGPEDYFNNIMLSCLFHTGTTFATIAKNTEHFMPGLQL